MRSEPTTNWRLDRRINLSILVQLLLLGSLILGSWLNLQRQLDRLGHDVRILLETQRQFQQKLEHLSETSISHEYRLQMIEKTPPT